jgi:predicted ArsR family transcriptional regulator
MDYEINQEISRMDEIKMQAQVLIPVLKAVRADLGEERANRLVLEALRSWSRERFKQMGAGISGSPKEKWDSINSRGMSRVLAEDLEIESLRKEPEVHELNVTRCKFAEFFRGLGEPELGAVLLCECDLQLAEEVGNPEVQLTRTQTLMQGECCCDFRFRIKSSSVPK